MYPIERVCTKGFAVLVLVGLLILTGADTWAARVKDIAGVRGCTA